MKSQIFVRTFFSKLFFDKKKIKFFDRIFFKVHLHNSENRFLTVRKRFQQYKPSNSHLQNYFTPSVYDYGSQTNEYSTVYHYCLVWFHEIDLEIIQDSSRFFAVCLKFRDSGEHEEGAETMRRQHMMWILGNRPGTPWTSGTLFGRIPKEYSSQSLLL